jgi:hypothetical protein
LLAPSKVVVKKKPGKEGAEATSEPEKEVATPKSEQPQK